VSRRTLLINSYEIVGIPIFARGETSGKFPNYFREKVKFPPQSVDIYMRESDLS